MNGSQEETRRCPKCLSRVVEQSSCGPWVCPLCIQTGVIITMVADPRTDGGTRADNAKLQGPPHLGGA